MKILAWDHNAYYHRLLLRQVPPGARRALEVGCGAGAFAAKLAKVVEHVDAIDRSPVMIDAARKKCPGNVSCILGDVLEDPLPSEGYDAIFSVCALHHMPLENALRRFESALRPGGVLAVVGLPRRDVVRELPYEVMAVAGHLLLGAGFAAARSTGRGRWYEREPTFAAMPVIRDPQQTTREMRAQAAAVLPGVQVRRLVFWRYFLFWQKPQS